MSTYIKTGKLEGIDKIRAFVEIRSSYTYDNLANRFIIYVYCNCTGGCRLYRQALGINYLSGNSNNKFNIPDHFIRFYYYKCMELWDYNMEDRLIKH